MGAIKRHIEDCAERFAHEIWDNGIADKEDAAILADYIFFEQSGEIAAVLTAEEITTANVDEYMRAMCDAVITYAGDVFTDPDGIIADTKEFLEVYNLEA